MPSRTRPCISRIRANASQYFVAFLMIVPIGSIVYYETYFPHGPHKLTFSLINDQSNSKIIPKVDQNELPQKEEETKSKKLNPIFNEQDISKKLQQIQDEDPNKEGPNKELAGLVNRFKKTHENHSKEEEDDRIQMGVKKISQEGTKYQISSLNLKDKANFCPQTIQRDYEKLPVVFEDVPKDLKCDIPCVSKAPLPYTYMDVSSSFEWYSNCPLFKKFTRTMEIAGMGSEKHRSDDFIIGTVKLDSDVPIQYFSWAEYDFMEPPSPKNASATLFAIISNCGPQFRLNYLEQLMKTGLKVDSYGKCLNNKEFRDEETSRLKHKLQMMKPYKFTFSFENSEHIDYVTEKMFGPLSAGSVPVYYGAPNARKFAPSPKSVIFVSDFESPEALAKYLQYLDSNDTAYNEYLQWKFDGPSKDFIALVDLSIVHSSCRYCIRSADVDRKKLGEVSGGPFQYEIMKEMEAFKNVKNAIMLKVRERGKFWLRRIHFVEKTIDEIHNKIFEKWDKKIVGDIYSINKLWERNIEIKTDEDVKQLQYGEELEIIFENPASQERGSYSLWYNERN